MTENTVRAFICFLLIILHINPASAENIKKIYGYKYPNSIQEGTAPVLSSALAPEKIGSLKGFNELLPFVTPAPDQEDANSCMLMSLTGVMEWWLQKLNNSTHFSQNGPYDLSERWWMNLSNDASKTSRSPYWFTDAVYLFNSSGAALNSDYPFVKNWYRETDEDIFPSAPYSKGSKYGVRYNWIDHTDNVPQPLVKLPKMTRKILFKSPNENPWAIGESSEQVVQDMIEAFQTYKAPIQVIYNHEGYWHSVYVIGYDDEMSSQGCPFVNESLAFYQKEADTANSRGDLKRSKKFLRYKAHLLKSFQSEGGCHPKGMFYVRDSQYPDPSEEHYIYDPQNPAANKPYSKRIVLREFDWIRTMANHVSVIYPKE